ncbi:MAG: efflux RND transporter periplasmic adaptor subunit [Pseudomonadota bacterium]
MPALRHAQTVLPFFSAAPVWRLRAGLVAMAVCATVLLSACGKPEAPAGAGAQRPPPEVGVVTVQPGEVGLVTELPGRVEAFRIAQVRARVAGIVQKRLFREGSDVKAGELLYAIDPAPYQAALQSAEAALARSQANLLQATALAERYKPLVAVNAVSKQDYDNAAAAQKQAEADVAAGKAAVQTARINLGYASVTAPIAGRIGRALVTEGALVGQGEATQLAVIQQIDPVYVNFTQSATEVMQLRNAMAAGQLQRAGNENAARVRIALEDGSEYALPGKLLFSDLTVDQATGQITLRAEVPNPKGDLLPGLYVRVRVEQAQLPNGITVPQQAVTRTQQGDTVTVVSPDGKLSPRKVKVGAARGNQWVVLDGLKAGEQVMVDGFQKLMMLPPGTPVKAVPWQAAAAGGAGAGAAAASGAQAAPAAASSPASAASAPAAARQ